MIGCARFDCDGAGQRVVGEVFAGARWHDRPELLEPMLDAFRALREVHALLLVLGQARRLPLTEAQERERAAWERAFDPPGGWSAASLAGVERGGLARRARAFLAALGHARNLRPLRRARAVAQEPRREDGKPGPARLRLPVVDRDP